MEFTPEFFDDASKAWRANKIRIAEGCFKYRKNAFTVKKEVKKKTKTKPEIKLRRSPRFTTTK
jgi:hypothetical protein